MLEQLILRAPNSLTEKSRWLPMMLGVLIVVAITAVPIFGWLVRLATVLFGLGALWIWGLDVLGKRRASQEVAES